MPPPILLIPGTAGSRMVARARGADHVEDAWVNSQIFPKPQYARKITHYLWGTPNPETLVYESYVREYASVEPVNGLSGARRLFAIKGLEGMLKRKRLGYYYETFINWFTTYHGYQEEVDLDAFTYDWRQEISHPCVLEGLRKTIKSLRNRNGGQRITLITHSLGGLVATSYMRRFSDWNDDVCRLVALCVPFDGVGGIGLLGFLTGYTLRLPIPYSCGRGVESSSGSFVSLLPAPGGCGGSSFVTSRIYVKKRMKSPTDLPPHSERQASGQIGRDEQKTDDAPTVCIKLSRNAYKHRIPDVAFCILERISADPNLLTVDVVKTLKLLQKCCKPRAVKLIFDGGTQMVRKRRRHRLEKLLERPFRDPENVPELVDLGVVYLRQNTAFSPSSELYPEGTTPLSCATSLSMSTSLFSPDLIPTTESDFLFQTSTSIIVSASNRVRPPLMTLPSEPTTFLWECYTPWAPYMTRNEEIIPLQFSRRVSGNASMHPDVCLAGDSIALRANTPFSQFLEETNGGFKGTRTLSWIEFPEICSHAETTVLLEEFSAMAEQIPTYVNVSGRVILARKAILNFNELPHIEKEPKIKRVDTGESGYGQKKPIEASEGGTSKSPIDQDLSLSNVTSTKEIEGRVEISDVSSKSSEHRTRSVILRPYLAPWASNISRRQIPERPILELIDHVIKPGTIDSLLFPSFHGYWKYSAERRETPIQFPTNPDAFRFLNLVAYGKETPLHVVYPRPVSDYSELPNQLPTFVFVQGDGTVILNSALRDGIPDAYVHDRVAFPGLTHTNMLHNFDVFVRISEFLGFPPIVRKEDEHESPIDDSDGSNDLLTHTSPSESSDSSDL
ncbi:putative Lecithin-cholesterol acyl transferase [Giardia muris]|uniref:Putative Lecithin-cholesterol acyl transferase n=1 Tax=Giardia muris TaxID=5742 RepID=A0A4Z1SQI8_GIAMU|nr:putative Lecithin-cholesterol acyl transferase [Giardia muris]|eukprot:TNJ27950.1 putative Lecithin-cholesterol acyl transferase [Giardia muris]